MLWQISQRLYLIFHLEGCLLLQMFSPVPVTHMPKKNTHYYWIIVFTSIVSFVAYKQPYLTPHFDWACCSRNHSFESSLNSPLLLICCQIGNFVKTGDSLLNGYWLLIGFSVRRIYCFLAFCCDFDSTAVLIPECD